MPARVNQDEYPTWVGFVFIFNLIVGTGALTLPSAFSKAGWVLGTIFIVILAFMSYMTVTFVIEAMACANAIQNWKRLQFIKRDRVVEHDDDSNVENISEPLIHSENEHTDASIEQTPLNIMYNRQTYYSLSNKIELGEMANMFFTKFGRLLFYFCLAIYLYGDLSIYSAAVATSLRDVICSSHNSSTNSTLDVVELCWDDHNFSRLDVYRLCLITFIMVLGPFVFFNVQKTKYLQLLTVFLRWLAFTVMISIAVHRLFAQENKFTPKTSDVNGIPYLIGTCIYSFMCHHSLPSLLTPISDKKKLKAVITWDYVLICAFYISLALTAIFAFADIKDLYTLNFVPNSDQDNIFLKAIEYFLALFPVFTLSASFPIIAITLKNNLQTLFLDTTQMESYNFFMRQFFFPLLAICPPIVVTFFTESVMGLVGFTGCYAGTGIQYIIPIALVYSARKSCDKLIGRGIINDYHSPFKGNFWLLLVFSWTISCIILVTIDMLLNP